MAYWLPRAVIVLIAWATTFAMTSTFTSVDPLVFYLAGAVWSVVSLISFSYLDRQWRDDTSPRFEQLVYVRQPAK